MTKRHWAALAVLLCVSVALGAQAPRERPIPDLTGTWCCSIRCIVRYPHGTRRYINEGILLYIDQYGSSADFYFDGFGLWLPGMVGHKYLVASDCYMGYDYGEVTLMVARWSWRVARRTAKRRTLSSVTSGPRRCPPAHGTIRNRPGALSPRQARVGRAGPRKPTMVHVRVMVSQQPDDVRSGHSSFPQWRRRSAHLPWPWVR